MCLYKFIRRTYNCIYVKPVRLCVMQDERERERGNREIERENRKKTKGSLGR